MQNTLSVEIPRDIVDSAGMDVSQLKIELALYLYAQGRIPLGKARELADMPYFEFRHLLASRHIAPHYGIQDLNEDLDVLAEEGFSS